MVYEYLFYNTRRRGACMREKYFTFVFYTPTSAYPLRFTATTVRYVIDPKVVHLTLLLVTTKLIAAVSNNVRYANGKIYRRNFGSTTR